MCTEESPLRLKNPIRGYRGAREIGSGDSPVVCIHCIYSLLTKTANTREAVFPLRGLTSPLLTESKLCGQTKTGEVRIANLRGNSPFIFFFRPSPSQMSLTL